MLKYASQGNNLSLGRILNIFRFFFLFLKTWCLIFVLMGQSARENQTLILFCLNKLRTRFQSSSNCGFDVIIFLELYFFCFLFENLDGNFHPHFNVSQTTHVGRMQLVEIMSIYASLDPKLVRLTRILWSVNCWFHYFTIFEK